MKTSKTIRFYRIASYLLMLGVVHSALTPVFYKTFMSVEAMWFFGTGLSLIFLGMLNIACSKILHTWMLKFTIAGNVAGTTFSLLIWFVLPAPQALVGFVFHLIVLLASVLAFVQVRNSVQ